MTAGAEGAGEGGALALLRALTQRHEVHLLSFIDHEDASARAMAEQVGLMAVHTVPYPKAGRGWPFAGIASGGPRSLAQKHSLLMQDYAFDLVVNDRFDVVVASEIDMLPYAVALPVAQRVLDGLEVGMYHDTLMRPWLRGGLRARVRWSRLTNYLQRNLAEFVLCTTVSEHERRLIDRYVAPACALIVTPNGVDVSACAQVRGAPRPDTLIYAGALTYAANFDAVLPNPVQSGLTLLPPYESKHRIPPSRKTHFQTHTRFLKKSRSQKLR
jgi:hypothetical protein